MTSLPQSANPRVLLTRSEADCASWAAELAATDIEALRLPCIRSEMLDPPGQRAALQSAVNRADWLVLTSRRGVESFASCIAETASALRLPAIATVGEATADAARRHLGRIDLIGTGTAERLASRFIQQSTAPANVLIVVAENASDTLESKLATAGFACQRFNVYRTVPAAARTPRTTLASLAVDAVFLASPSAVTGFTNQISPCSGIPLITIGPSTSNAVREKGLEVAAEAPTTSLDGMVAALRSVLARISTVPTSRPVANP